VRGVDRAELLDRLPEDRKIEQTKMRFLRTTTGALINTNYIVHVEPEKPVKGVAAPLATGSIATLADGEKAGFFSSIDDIEKALQTVVPAGPGFMLLRLVLDAPEEKEIQRLPVVAWRIDQYSAVAHPVVCEDVSDMTSFDVLQPTGEVVNGRDGVVYANEADWLADARAKVNRDDRVLAKTK